MLILIELTLLFFLSLCVHYWNRRKPTSLLNGFFAALFLLTVWLAAIIWVERWNEQIAIYIALPLIIPFILISIFGLSASIVGLFWNERILLKREGKNINNLIPLFLGLSLLFLEIILITSSLIRDNAYLNLCLNILLVSTFYFIFIFILYGLTSILYNIFPIRKPVDYIIILGAGLIDGERVTPLLSSRIDRGLALYYDQKKFFKNKPQIVLSGGKGPDEKISEAEAMLNYINEEYGLTDSIYLEVESRNTYENLMNSMRLIFKTDGISSFEDKTVAIATSNYHLLRAGKLANSIGFLARGVGSKTRLYYFPTAFIREYIGYLVMSKKKHVVFLVIVYCLMVLEFWLFQS